MPIPAGGDARPCFPARKTGDTKHSPSASKTSSGHFSVLARLPNKSPYPEEKYEGRGEQPPRLQYAFSSEKGSPGPDPRRGSQSEEARQDSQKFPGRGSNSGTVPSGTGYGAGGGGGGGAGKGLEGNWFLDFANRFLMSTV